MDKYNYSYLDTKGIYCYKDSDVLICIHSCLADLLRKYGNICQENGYKILTVKHYSYNQRGCGNDEKFYEYASESLGIASRYLEDNNLL